MDVYCQGLLVSNFVEIGGPGRISIGCESADAETGFLALACVSSGRSTVLLGSVTGVDITGN
jgi:hypothetical protein